MTSILICTDLRTRLSHQCCLILSSPESLCSVVVTYCLQFTPGTVPVFIITAGSLYVLSMCYIMFLLRYNASVITKRAGTQTCMQSSC